MAINLLPAEQKLKAKKLKKETVARRIELTGPAEMEKKKPGVKKAGVLMFFKQAFQKPKKKEELEEAKKLPEKKVIFKEKIIFEKPKEVKPKVVFYGPQRKPEPLKVKPSFQPGKKIAGFFSGLFKRKAPVPPKVEEKKPPVPEEQFPKYKPVKPEKVLPKPEGVPIKAEVVELAAKKIEVVKEEPKKKEKSAWQRLVDWLKGVFGRKPPPKPVPKPLAPEKRFPEYKSVKAEKILPTPAVKPRQPEVIKLTTKKVVTEKEKSKKRGKSFWQRLVDWLKGVFGRKRQEAKPVPLAKEPVKPERLPEEKPIVIEREEVVVFRPEEKIPEVPPLPDVDKKIGEPKKPREKAELFSYATPLPPAVSEKKEPEEKALPRYEIVKPPSFVPPPKEEVKEKVEKEIKPIFPLPPEKKEKKPFGLLVWFSKLWQAIKNLFRKKKEEEEVKPEKPEKVPVPVSPPPLAKKEKSFRLALPEDKRLPLTQPAEMMARPSEMDWEVNLIPEEALEKEISLSKLLYLAMSLVVAGALIFGGWLWANYHYNNITITISEVRAEIAAKNGEISRYQHLQEEMQILKQKITNVWELLDKHIYWSQIFSRLEEYTISEVYYKSMTADVNGSVTLSAVGKDYEVAIKQLFVFEKASDFVTNVTISNITFIQTEVAPTITTSPETTANLSSNRPVTFTISLSVLPSIFYYPQ